MTLGRLLVGCSALLLVVSCGKARPGDPLTTGDAGQTQGVSGAAPVAGQGTGGSGMSAAGGMVATTAGASGGGSSGSMSASSGAGGMGGGGTGGAEQDRIVDVWKSEGCGKPAQGGPGIIATMGVKAPDCAAKLDGQSRCGPWGQEESTWLKTPLEREHLVTLPQDYDAFEPYPLVLQGPGCGGTAADVYSLDDSANGTVIRVGITPADAMVGHGTNPRQGCFDDKEGDDSLDWVHYEALYDKLNQELCFDRNRVFVSGNSSGAWFANELGCKYAGDPARPVRGVLVDEGGLPSEPQYKPTCTAKPMSGLWVFEIDDTSSGFSGERYAISRAMSVSGCTGTDYQSAVLQPYPVPGRLEGECKQLTGCLPLYPLVVCKLQGNGTLSHEDVVNPTASQFLRSFLKPPLHP